MKYLFFADYGSGPFWIRHKDGVIAVPTRTLGLPEKLEQEIDEWSREYDALEQSNYQWSSVSLREAWLQKGRELLLKVQEFVGDQHEITSHLDSTA